MPENNNSSKKKILTGVAAGFVAGLGAGYTFFVPPSSCYPGRPCQYVGNVCTYMQNYNVPPLKQAGAKCP